MAREFDYRISTFHHAVESYKIADLLAEEGICSAMWSEQWGFKLEAFDAIPENVALVDAAGACAIVHSDSPIGIQRLNQEAAKAMAAARRQGMTLDEANAIRWITLNAARSLEIDAETGSIEEGKAADLVLWSDNPFSVYARADQVYIDWVPLLRPGGGCSSRDRLRVGGRPCMGVRHDARDGRECRATRPAVGVDFSGSGARSGGYQGACAHRDGCRRPRWRGRADPG